jgi:hypothetical protein
VVVVESLLVVVVVVAAHKTLVPDERMAYMWVVRVATCLEDVVVVAAGGVVVVDLVVEHMMHKDSCHRVRIEVEVGLDTFGVEVVEVVAAMRLGAARVDADCVNQFDHMDSD